MRNIISETRFIVNKSIINYAPLFMITFVVGFWLWLPNNISITITMVDKPKEKKEALMGVVTSTSITCKVDSVQQAEETSKTNEVFVFDVFKPKKDNDIAAVNYISRFAEVAQVEQRKYGQFASVKLAQGLLESDRGRSSLAVDHNNHFGIKCFSKTCKKGHCVNRTDDSHKDYFLVFDGAWSSYRAHSKFLQKDRYLPCKKSETYQEWCRCLKEKGYATDPRYADTLISIIERYKLYQFDL